MVVLTMPLLRLWASPLEALRVSPRSNRRFNLNTTGKFITFIICEVRLVTDEANKEFPTTT